MSNQELNTAIDNFIITLFEKDVFFFWDKVFNAFEALINAYDSEEEVRHSYSYISDLLYKKTEDDIECATLCSSNIYSISDGIKEIHKTLIGKYNITQEQLCNTERSIDKLLDFIKAEIIRITYFCVTEVRVKEIKETLFPKFNTLQENVNTLKESTKDFICELNDKQASINDINTKIEGVNTKIEGVNTTIEGVNTTINDIKSKVSDVENIKEVYPQLISILGIFSAIVVAFFGGLGYFTSVFNNIHQSSTSKVLMVSSLVGLVVFNTIFALLYGISKLTDRSITSTCRYGKCPCYMLDEISECKKQNIEFNTIAGLCDKFNYAEQNNKLKECRAINKLRYRIPYIFYVNAFLCYFLLLVTSYYVGVHIWNIGVRCTLIGVVIIGLVLGGYSLRLLYKN